MGHLSHHKAYIDLRARLDRMPAGFPDTAEGRELLHLLFLPEEAELAAVLPFRPSSAARIARRAKRAEAEVRKLLEQMADRGLVFDFKHPRSGEMRYCAAPPVVGFFEFSMMRRTDLDQHALAKAYEAYFETRPGFGDSLFAGETQFGRTLVRESTLTPDQVAEALPYERASQVVGSASSWAVSLCYCRHKAEHLGRACSAPMENCLSINWGADYLIRHHLARPISRAEALETLDRGLEANLVCIADNVQQQVTWLCSCCGCCCELLRAVNRHGLSNAVMTSGWLAHVDGEKCKGCGRCARRCPVQGISLQPRPPVPTEKKPHFQAKVDESICLGCGLCRSACRSGALSMPARDRRVLTPESTLERLLLTALERDRLADVLLDEVEGPSQALLLRLSGALLRLPPVKRALLGDRLRSRFINYLAASKKQVPAQLR